MENSARIITKWRKSLAEDWANWRQEYALRVKREWKTQWASLLLPLALLIATIFFVTRFPLDSLSGDEMLFFGIVFLAVLVAFNIGWKIGLAIGRNLPYFTPLVVIRIALRIAAMFLLQYWVYRYMLSAIGEVDQLNGLYVAVAPIGLFGAFFGAVSAARRSKHEVRLFTVL